MNTELIVFNSKFHGIGEVMIDVDFEVGDSTSLNNFEIMSAPLVINGEEAHGFYIDGTEYGGVFEYEHGTSDAIVETLKGWTWRGLLTQGIITPPPGSNYYIASGDANTIIGNILSNHLGGFFTVPETSSGCWIGSYQFPLYCNILDGLMNMLAKKNYRLSIHAEKSGIGQPVAVTVEAVPVQQVSGTFNADSPIQLEFVYNRMGINHLVCMGQGELQQRQRVDLYINKAGNVSQAQYYTGFDERTAYYDYASAESLESLTQYGSERLLELASSDTVAVHAREDIEMEIGDTIRAAYKGSTVVAPIVRKILKIERGAITQEYKVKGEL